MLIRDRDYSVAGKTAGVKGGWARSRMHLRGGFHPHERVTILCRLRVQRIRLCSVCTVHTLRAVLWLYSTLALPSTLLVARAHCNNTCLDSRRPHSHREQSEHIYIFSHTTFFPRSVSVSRTDPWRTDVLLWLFWCCPPSIVLRVENQALRVRTLHTTHNHTS